MLGSVYLETTVISYLAARPSSDIIVAAHQKLTQGWWHERRSLFSLYVSELVLTEAAAGDPEASQRRLSALVGIPILTIAPPVADLARRILQDARLPERAIADAVHVASPRFTASIIF
jgi:hypothetical protein